MTKKRLFGCITAILVLISMFSGCTNKNIAEKFEVPQYEDDKTITIGAWTGGWIFGLQGTMKPEYWEMYEKQGCKDSMTLAMESTETFVGLPIVAKPCEIISQPKE